MAPAVVSGARSAGTGALLTEGPDVSVHPRPKKPVPQLCQDVVGPKVADERVTLGQKSWSKG